MTSLDTARALVSRLAAAFYNFEAYSSKDAITAAFADDALLRLCHPLTTGRDGVAEGSEGYWSRAIGPLAHAMPDLERRPFISMAGEDHDRNIWVGQGGHYMGTWGGPFLDIPATGHLAHMRFHEFFRVVDGKIVEVQMIWDLPELMMQSGCWPMSPSLGRDWCVPGPATCDGLLDGSADPKRGAASCQFVIEMLSAMTRHPSQGGPEVMEMDRFWSYHMNWYGPTGIGTGRGIEGFRKHHQIPFLAAMPDRGQNSDNTHHHFFGDGDYVAVTGWPNMAQTLTHSGWLGIAPSGQPIELRSLDFWRLEGEGKRRRIRENWVLVDLLDMYHQLDVDVLARMRGLTTPRNRTRLRRN
ncbi:MAG: ester cyclase [Pseudomonadota bacterium]